MRNSKFDVDQLQSLLARALDATGRSGGLTLVRVKSRGQNNTLYRAQTEAFPYPLAVKVCIDGHTGELNPKSARRQFDQLTRLSRMANGRNFRVIEPIWVCEERGIVVTKWVDGVTLSNTMRSVRPDVEVCSRACRKAGAWLSSYHSIESASDKPLETTAVLENLSQTFSEKSSKSKSTGLTKYAVHVLRATAPKVDQLSIPQRSIHGDFHPGNLMWEGQALIGVDIEISRVDNNLHDIVTWMNHMSHLTLMPRCLGLRRRISQLSAAFLDGYRSEPDSATVDEKALLWLRTVHATSFLERYRSTGATVLHDAYFRLAAGYNLRLLCKRLSGAV